MLLDIGGGELLLLVVLAAVLLGPDRVPPLARKAARILRFLRGVANNATEKIKTELGPDVADLNIKDFTPAGIVQGLLPTGPDPELEALRAEVEGMRTEMARVQLTTGRPLTRPRPVAVPPPTPDVEPEATDQPPTDDPTTP